MAIIKRVVGQVTLSRVVDVVSITYFYLLMPSIAPAPSKPTTNPPTTYQTEGYDGWGETEPTYVSGDTRSLYVTVRTVYGDGSFAYTTPSLSSSYEAAKAAYNRAQSAMSLAGDINQYFWNLTSAYSTNVPAGTYITEVAQSLFKPNPSGGNVVIQSTGITIRNGTTQLASLTGLALNFYNPQATQGQNSLQLSIGANGTLQSGNYQRGTDTKFSTDGTKIDLINGDIITKYFRLSQGLENLNAGAYIHGTIEALDGKIGAGSNNYWEIGQYTDYNNTTNATMVGHGGSFIQLGDSSTWRLATNRIHTGWYTTGDTVLHYPQDENNKYWDFGIHVPYSDSPSGRGNDKFIYIRTQKAANNSLENLLYDLDDNYSTQQWNYKFWIDSNGNISTTGSIDAHNISIDGQSIAGGSLVAGSLASYGGSATQPVYFPSSGDNQGKPVAINYTIGQSVPSDSIWIKNVTTSGSGNAVTAVSFDSATGQITATKGATYLTSYTETDPTVPSWAKASTKPSYSYNEINGTVPQSALPSYVDDVVEYSSKSSFPTTGETGKIYVDTSTNLTWRWSGTTYVEISPSLALGETNSTAYRGDRGKTAYDHASAKGSAFTSGLYKITTNSEGHVTAATTANKSDIGLGNVENKSSATIRGELTSANITNALGFTPYDEDNPDGYTTNEGTVTSVRVQASSPLQSSTSTAQNVSLNTTISFANQNANTILAGPASDSTAAAPTFRTLVAADIPDLSGSYYLASNPDHYTDNEGTITGVTAGTGLSGGGSSGGVTLNHSNSVTAQTTQAVYPIKIDAQGHISAYGSSPTTLSGYGITDAKIVNGVITLGSNTITPLTSQWTANLITGTSATVKANEAASNNVYLNLVENNTVRNSHQITGSGTVSVASDASGKITITGSAHPTALNGVSFADGVITFTKTDGTSTTIQTDNFVIEQASGATALVGTDTNHTPLTVTGPVKFVAGIPVTMDATNGDSIPSSLISGTISPSSHTHGNITNGGEITSTVVTVGNNDALLFADSSNNGKIERLAAFDGSTTTQFLSKKGTWETPVGSVTGVKGNSESSYRTGNVNLTAANIGAATSGHTHTTTLAAAASGDTSQLTLAYNTKYKLTAGGTDYIFTMPASDNTDTHRPIQLKGTEILGNNTTALNFAEGDNITLSNSGGTITINSSYTNTDEKVKLSAISTQTGTYPLMLAPTGTLTSGNTYQGYYHTGITVTPNTGTVTATTFVGALTGNASSATEFSSNATVTLTGDVTGTSEGSKKSWSVATTIGEGKVTNAMLAGSIANGKLANSSITIGSKTINLGDTVTLAQIGAGTSNLTLGTTATTAYRGDYGNTAYTHATDSGRLTTAKSSAFYKFSVTAHGHVGSVTAVTGDDISELLSFGTAYNSSSNKIATISDVTGAINGADNKYVTIATDQTITASQKTFNGAIRWGTASKYGACNYDSTLDALVFSFYG